MRAFVDMFVSETSTSDQFLAVGTGGFWRWTDSAGVDCVRTFVPAGSVRPDRPRLAYDSTNQHCLIFSTVHSRPHFIPRHLSCRYWAAQEPLDFFPERLPHLSLG